MREQAFHFEWQRRKALFYEAKMPGSKLNTGRGGPVSLAQDLILSGP